MPAWFRAVLVATSAATCAAVVLGLGFGGSARSAADAQAGREAKQVTTRFLNALNGFVSTVAPVSQTNAKLFADQATTYEAIATHGLGAQSTVAGGGRYDGLVKELGGPDVPGIGFAAGVERMALLLAQEGREAAAKPLVFLAPLGPAEEARADQLAQELRAAGVPVEVSFRRANPGNQLKRADAPGARYAVVIGDAELKSDKAKLKELKTGVQREVTLSQLVAELRKLEAEGR